MKYILIALLCIVSLTTHAQQARRIYYVDSNNLAISDSAGTTPVPYHRTSVSILALGDRIRVQVFGNTPVLFTPAKFLNKNGVPYSTASVAAAFTAFVASIPVSSTGNSGTGGGLSETQVKNLIYAAVDTAHSHLDETSFLGSGTTADPFRAKPGRGFNPRGVWAANTLYATDDLVTVNGNTYRAISAFTSGSSFNAANWELWAAKGSDGANLNADYGIFPTMLFKTEAISLATANLAMTSGSVYLRKLVAPKTGTVTSFTFRVSTAGATLTAGAANNGIAIYDASGNMVGGIGDCNTAFTSTGDKTVSLATPAALTAGTTYYIAIISTGTTAATVLAAPGSNAINIGQASPPYNFQRVTTGGLTATIALTGGTISDARGSGRLYIAGY